MCGFDIDDSNNNKKSLIFYEQIKHNQAQSVQKEICINYLYVDAFLLLHQNCQSFLKILGFQLVIMSLKRWKQFLKVGNVQLR